MAQTGRVRTARGVRWGIGALVGLLAAGVALGVGEVAAAFVRPAAAPIIAVGNRVIALTPQPVKHWAIRSFGTSDKAVLLTGIYVLLGLLAVAVGMLALRHVAYGVAGIVAFGAFGCYCALTAGAAQSNDVTPTLIGAVAGAVALVVLARAAGAASVTSTVSDALPGGADRRRFLLGSAAAAGVAVLTGFGGRAAQHARFDAEKARRKVALPAPASPAGPLPAGTDLGKSGVPWQTPNGRFYRIDTALAVPQVDPDTWSLRIHGMVEHPITLTYQDVLDRPLIERWITLCCVSNEVGGSLIGNAKFLGAPLQQLMREAGLSPDADQLLMTSVDGMTIGCPAAIALDGRDSMLAVGMNGQPLPVDHGFPVRAVVPGLYGYTSACKWITDIEATTFARQAAYWVEGGWLAHPPVSLASRIDRPSPNAAVPAGRPVAVAGVAWDQHVGVSAVQLQVDDGPWQEARLAAVPSADTWRQWVLAWTPPATGTYRLRVRAVDATGAVQPQTPRRPYPGAASGWHTITVRAG